MCTHACLAQFRIMADSNYETSRSEDSASSSCSVPTAPPPKTAGKKRRRKRKYPSSRTVSLHDCTNPVTLVPRKSLGQLYCNYWRFQFEDTHKKLILNFWSQSNLQTVTEFLTILSALRFTNSAIVGRLQPRGGGALNFFSGTQPDFHYMGYFTLSVHFYSHRG